MASSAAAGEAIKRFETEEIDADEVEGSDSDEEGCRRLRDWRFWGGIDDFGSMVSMGREEVSEDREMRIDFASAKFRGDRGGTCDNHARIGTINQ